MPTPQCQELWPGPGDTYTRVWVASISAPGNAVVVRHVAVLAPGENLTEYPETWELTWGEWVDTHTTNYGLTIDGQASAEANADRLAWRKLRRVAAGTDPLDAAYATAVLRVLRAMGREVLDP